MDATLHSEVDDWTTKMLEEREDMTVLWITPKGRYRQNDKVVIHNSFMSVSGVQKYRSPN